MKLSEWVTKHPGKPVSEQYAEWLKAETQAEKEAAEWLNARDDRNLRIQQERFYGK